MHNFQTYRPLRLIAYIYKFIVTLLSALIRPFQEGVGHARRLRSHVRQSWPGFDPVANSTSAAVYVHFDRLGVVHDYVIHQLRDLAAAGFRVTFVSNSPEFRTDSVTSVAPFCREVIWRRNVGYDFGGYKDGIAALGNLDELDRLLLMNDSVYGPFRPIASVLREIDQNQTDMWGITDSWEFNYHIQTYFIVFFGRALHAPTFKSFWRTMPYVNGKNWVIRRGEIRLTQTLTKHKLRASVLAPYWDVAKTVVGKLERQAGGLTDHHEEFPASLRDRLARRVAINQSHFFWDTLISDYRCPFIKRELILLNPAKVPATWRWEEVIKHESHYDVDLIRRHLRAS